METPPRTPRTPASPQSSWTPSSPPSRPPAYIGRRLHNFTLPGVGWGKTRFLRCTMVPPDLPPSSSPRPTSPFSRSDRPVPEPTTAENDCVTSDFRPLNETAAENRNDEDDGAGNGAAMVRSRHPHRIRTPRRTSQIKESADLPPGSGRNSEKKKEKEKFTFSLLKEEIEEDFAAMGIRLPKRSKKRPNAVQKKIENLYPGFWLPEEVTEEMYSVHLKGKQ